jgi:hypothetical protein
MRRYANMNEVEALHKPCAMIFVRTALPTPALSRWQCHLPRERENCAPMAGNDGRLHRFMDWMRDLESLKRPMNCVRMGAYDSLRPLYGR